MQMSIDVEGVIFIPVLTLVLAAICYSYARAVRRGQPLTGVQKRMIAYACVFCFGMGYSMVFKDQLKAALRWKDAWVGFTILWGLMLATFAWYRHRRNRRSGQDRPI
jgi:predicted Na+-dependent transporter